MIGSSWLSHFISSNEAGNAEAHTQDARSNRPTLDGFISSARVKLEIRVILNDTTGSIMNKLELRTKE